MDKLNLIRKRTGHNCLHHQPDLCAGVYLFPDGTTGFGLDLMLIKSGKPWALAEFSYGQFWMTLTGFLLGVVSAFWYNLVGYCPACRDKP